MRFLLGLTLVAALTLASQTARAAGPKVASYSFDKAHCSVNFLVRHIYVGIPGRFAEFDGVVKFDPKNLEASLIDVSVNPASLSTDVPKRDEHLRSPDFFDTAKFPKITFKSSKIKHVSGQDYLAVGTLSLKDVSREIELPFTYHGEKPSPLEPSRTVAGFTAKLSLNLLDYRFCDPKWQAMGVIGDEAQISVYTELFREP